MEINEQRSFKDERSYAQGAAGDAPAGNCQRRTAAGPPAAPKLVRKTFLVDHTESHSDTHSSGGSTWSVKIHDFGKQWIESSWGKVDPHPGKRGLKGKSLNKEQNEKRARARATGEIRRKCLSIGADHLVTLTYRDNVEDRERVLTDLERLRRMLSRGGYSMLPWLCWNARSAGRSIHIWLFVDFRIFVSYAAVGTRLSEKHRAK